MSGEWEIEKSINPIVDYKKVIFKPCDNNWNIIDKFKCKSFQDSYKKTFKVH
jgi:hypothetical protein